MESEFTSQRLNALTVASSKANEVASPSICPREGDWISYRDPKQQHGLTVNSFENRSSRIPSVTLSLAAAAIN